LSRHPIDVLRAALQEAKTEAATLRIKTTTLAQKRNAAILERNEARRERDAALSEGRGLLAQRQTWRGIAMQHEGALRALEKPIQPPLSAGMGRTPMRGHEMEAAKTGPRPSGRWTTFWPRTGIRRR
jgi:hypothetical protein